VQKIIIGLVLSLVIFSAGFLTGNRITDREHDGSTTLDGVEDSVRNLEESERRKDRIIQQLESAVRGYKTIITERNSELIRYREIVQELTNTEEEGREVFDRIESIFGEIEERDWLSGKKN
jgi:uncharacterized membrane protein